MVVPHLAREQAGELEGVICVLASSKGKSPLLAYSINTVRHPREYPTAVYMTHTNILHLFSGGFYNTIFWHNGSPLGLGNDRRRLRIGQGEEARGHRRVLGRWCRATKVKFTGLPRSLTVAPAV